MSLPHTLVIYSVQPAPVCGWALLPTIFMSTGDQTLPLSDLQISWHSGDTTQRLVEIVSDLPL